MGLIERFIEWLRKEPVEWLELMQRPDGLYEGRVMARLREKT